MPQGPSQETPGKVVLGSGTNALHSKLLPMGWQQTIPLIWPATVGVFASDKKSILHRTRQETHRIPQAVSRTKSDNYDASAGGLAALAGLDLALPTVKRFGLFNLRFNCLRPLTWQGNVLYSRALGSGGTEPQKVSRVRLCRAVKHSMSFFRWR